MAAITFRLANVTVNGNLQLVDGTDQTAATLATGWTLGKSSAALTSEMVVGSESASGNFTSNSTTPKPGTVGTNAFRSQNPYHGSIDTTAWSIVVAFRSVSTAYSGTIRARCRVFASANADGSGARELTGSTQVGSTTGAGSTSADTTSTVSWTPGAIIELNNEYIFITVACEIVTASGSNTADALLRTGTSTTGTRVVTGNFTAATAKSGSDSGTTSESGSVAQQKVTGTARLALSSVGTPTAGTVTLHVRAQMGGSDSGVLRVWLYQGATLIEGPYDISLTTSFATDDHVVSNAGSITDWTSLEVRLQGISSTAHDTLSPQVSYVALESPASATTPISDTDSGSDSEAQSLTAQESSSDTGTSTEIISTLVRQVPDSATDSEITAIKLAGTDAGSDSESSTVTVPITGTDSGSDTEAILKIAISGITDSGTDSEAFTEVAQIPGTDTGSDAENGSLRLLGADSGTETEAQTEVAQISGADSGSGAEVGSIREITSDAGSDTEANQLTAQIPVTDANGATAENASTGTPVSATDTASDSEATQLVASASTPDSATDSEIPRIGLNGSDGNLDTESLALHAAIQPTDAATATDNASTNTQSSFTSSDTAGASESAQEAVNLASGPETASGADNASVRVFLNPAAEAGSSLEAQVLAVHFILSEAGISIDTAAPQVSWIRTDSGSGSEQQFQTITPLDGDSAFGSDGYSISTQLLDSDAVQTAELAGKIDLTAAPRGIERNLIATGVEQGVLFMADTEIAVTLAKSLERGSLLEAR